MDPLTLKTREIVGSQPGNRLLITGGVHGDEFEPIAAMRELSRRLDADELCGSVTLVPVVNESAFYLGRRTGEDGLDLARTCPGRVDGSITEQVAAALTSLIRSADYYIDLHTGGTTLAVYPLAGYMLHPKPEVLEMQRRMARAMRLPVVWGTDYRLEGRSLSVARDANVPAIYAEYEGSARMNPVGVTAYVDGCLNVMAELGMLQRAALTAMTQIVVEDSRPSSGHMQIQNPAPRDGFFTPAVALGDTVAVGQTLGTVADELGDHVEAIIAQQSGMILVLRTFPMVQKGDSVAVILDR